MTPARLMQRFSRYPSAAPLTFQYEPPKFGAADETLGE
jgi:hypothetical protein